MAVKNRKKQLVRSGGGGCEEARTLYLRPMESLLFSRALEGFVVLHKTKSSTRLIFDGSCRFSRWWVRIKYLHQICMGICIIIFHC